MATAPPAKAGGCALPAAPGCGRQELCFLPGEEFSIFNQEARRWLALCPRLRQDRDLDAENRGVTYVLLKK